MILPQNIVTLWLNDFTKSLSLMKNQANQAISPDDQLGNSTSKTKRKEQMEELQDLGVKLIDLSLEQLNRFDLPSTLFDAIKLAKTLKANGAIRRQNQYIGKLMRDIDTTLIRDRLDELNGISSKSTAILHLCENWRDQLLDSNDKLNEFIHAYPHCDINALRTLVRVVRKEQEAGQNRNYRKLFQLIRSTIEDVGERKRLP